MDRYLKPLVRAARQHPASAGWIKLMAHAWWRGVYHNGPRTGPRETWTLSGDVEFNAEWDRLLNADPSALPLTFGTIYTDASDAGWPALTTDQLYTKQEVADTWQEQRDLNMELVEDLWKRVSDGHADAPFEHEFLNALAYFCDDDPYEFSRIKAKLKRANPQVR